MGYGKEKLVPLTILTTAVAGVGILCVVARYRTRLINRLRYLLDFKNPLRHRQIKVIETLDECQRVVETLKKHCVDYNVLGFDCEWVTVGGTRRPIALLQLSSRTGLCALFRLCNLEYVPKSLRELLEDEAIIKVGVAPQDDAKNLAHDFGACVANTLDLRYMAVMAGIKPEGLAKLSKALLNVHLDKNWRLVCSDWEANVLTEKQLHYAATDALVAIEIFKKLSQKLKSREFWQFRQLNQITIQSRLEPFFNVRFKDGIINKETTSPNGLSSKKTTKKIVREYSTRSKALYDNCLLEAPDGELLCTIDRRKAQWYLMQNLGEQVKTEPFTVRLNFEPAGRAVGEVGRYYQIPKENQCVVCGRRDAYIRKNVVPREYRKHFPVVMKSHTSHDILLLCPPCHQLSNISDLKVRSKLAEMCGAPYAHAEGGSKCVEIPEMKQLKSAARALLHNGEKIPVDRKEHLKQIVLKHYPNHEVLTADILEEAANVRSTIQNENYCLHGEKVVLMFQMQFGGLIELERLWREHFLNTMQPKFLPQLWNINHNADRLEIRAHEGRVDKVDLARAGVEATNDTLTATSRIYSIKQRF